MRNYEDGDAADKLFTINFKTHRDDKPVYITAWRETCHDNSQTRQIGVVLEVRHRGRVIFPRGQLWGRWARHWAFDSPQAKRWAVDCVAYAGDGLCTEAQRMWLARHAEVMQLMAEDRYVKGGDR